MTKKMSAPRPRKARKTIKVRFLPFDISIDVPPRTTILDALARADLPLKTTCGGKGTCGDCTLQIISGSYQSKPSAALSEKLVAQGYALACLTEINNTLTVQLPKFQQLSIKTVTDSKFLGEHRNDISGIYEVRPIIRKLDLQTPPPTLEDNYSDFKRLQRELRRGHKIEHLSCEYSVLRTLPHAIRATEGFITVVLLGTAGSWTIIDVEPKTAEKHIYGVACDVGTTTVALHLVDLENGEILNTTSAYNQQLKCGDDIISRINYARTPERLQELHKLLVKTINHLIGKASEATQIASSDIYYASVSGNTTMIHLLLNLDPQYIREEPYVPILNQVPLILSRDLGLKMNHEGRVHCAPAVGSYVGGDITAGLLCTPIIRECERISLFMDVGTNGELVAGNRDWLITCACSAGPAFEGSGIRCGMPASEGAIEKLKLEGNARLEYKVIGRCKPKGLCGSGLIDLLAELFIHGYVDRHGKFNEKRAGARVVKTEGGKGFLIEKGENCYWERDLIITENDIANLIRTKGAVFSACSLWLKKMDLTFDRIDSFYVAGGFGQHLNIENAVRIGLFPDLDRNKFHYLGNTSLLGAYLVLLSNKNGKMVDEIAEKMTYIELNTDPSYMNEYTGALFLPHTDIDLFPSVKAKLDSQSWRDENK